MSRRVSRLNSLLKEVLSEVLTKDLHHIPGLSEFFTITSVEITADLSYAKVFVSVIGNASAKTATCEALNRTAGLIHVPRPKRSVCGFFHGYSFLLMRDWKSS